MPSLNSSSPLPLYHQLAEVLQERIRSGEYPSGARIPSEPELARTYGIGRPTVRQATDVLVRRQLLERRRGSGTFVIEPPEQVDLLSLAGTLASFEKGGINVRTSLVERMRRLAVPADPENPLSGRESLFFSRLSRVRGVPVLLEEIYLDPEVFPGIERVAMAGRSLSKLVEEHYHLRLTSASQNFRVSPAGSRRGALLERPARSSLLLVKRTLDFESAKAAIFAELYCRTDQLVFSQTLQEGGIADE